MGCSELHSGGNQQSPRAVHWARSLALSLVALLVLALSSAQAGSLPLSDLLDRAEPLSVGLLTFSDFHLSPIGSLQTFPRSELSALPLLDGPYVGLRFGSFTAPPQTVREASLRYTVSAPYPLQTLSLHTPPFVPGPSSDARSLQDAGFVVFTGLSGDQEVETFADAVGCCRNDPVIRNLALPAANRLVVQNTIQVFGGDRRPGSQGSPSLTLPYIENWFVASGGRSAQVQPIPEPRTSALLLTGLLLLARRMRRR
ncbi:hypothetical protein [Candidatus Nitrospira bockiana]